MPRTDRLRDAARDQPGPRRRGVDRARRRALPAACSGRHWPTDLAGSAMSESPGTLAWTIANGVAGTPMPGFSVELAARDRWDLVNYLRGPSAGP